MLLDKTIKPGHNLVSQTTFPQGRGCIWRRRQDGSCHRKTYINNACGTKQQSPRRSWPVLWEVRWRCAPGRNEDSLTLRLIDQVRVGTGPLHGQTVKYQVTKLLNWYMATWMSTTDLLLCASVSITECKWKRSTRNSNCFVPHKLAASKIKSC